MWHLHAVMLIGQACNKNHNIPLSSDIWLSLLLMSLCNSHKPAPGAHRWHKLLHHQDGDEDD